MKTTRRTRKIKPRMAANTRRRSSCRLWWWWPQSLVMVAMSVGWLVTKGEYAMQRCVLDSP